MSELNDLEEKLKRWLQPHPAKQSLIQLAGSAIAIKNNLELEEWDDEHSFIKKICLNHLDSITHYLYLLKILDGRPDKNNPTKEESRLKKKMDAFQPAASRHSSLLEQQQAFNAISTPGKKEFLRRAKALSKHENDSCREFAGSTSRVLSEGAYEEIGESLRSYVVELNAILNTVNYTDYVKELRETAHLEDGPKTLKDMHLLYSAFIFVEKPDRDNVIYDTQDPNFHRKMANKAHLEIMTRLEEMLSDIPRKKLVNLLSQEFESLNNVCKTHGFYEELLISQMHYFLSHSEEKLQPQDYAALSDGMYSVRLHSGFQFHNDYPQLAADRTPEAMMKMFEGAWDKYHVDYPKPSADEVFENTMVAIETYYSDVGRPDLTQEKQERFEQILSVTPEGMADIVLLHYQENEEIRKIRKGAFRTQKEKFIKDLAMHHEDDLLDAEFSDEDIVRMREKGKLPPESGWTIEHVVDRDHGGTNHWHNFVLMSDEINTDKDVLKKIQTYVQPDVDQGCWIRSWAPKKLPDGTYPKIVVSNDVRVKEAEVELSLDL